MPVFAYEQGSANFYGFEVEANAELGNALGIHWDGDLVADYVHAKVKDFGPAPQIPPLRLLGGSAAARGPVDGPGRGRACLPPEPQCAAGNRDRRLYACSTRRSTGIRSPTRPDLTLGLAANNIFDVVARRAFEPAQGLCPARRPRYPPDGEVRLLRQEKSGPQQAAAAQTGRDGVDVPLKFDPGGDRFEFADPFLEVRDLDPAALAGGRP